MAVGRKEGTSQPKANQRHAHGRPVAVVKDRDLGKPIRQLIGQALVMSRHLMLSSRRAGASGKLKAKTSSANNVLVLKTGKSIAHLQCSTAVYCDVNTASAETGGKRMTMEKSLHLCMEGIACCSVFTCAPMRVAELADLLVVHSQQDDGPSGDLGMRIKGAVSENKDLIKGRAVERRE